MDSTHSVTRLIARVQGGDEAAARELYGRLYDWLLSQARIRLRGRELLLTQPEDLASRAFERLNEFVCRPGVRDRNDLRCVLVRVIHNWARNKTRYERRPSARRGGAEEIRGGDEVGRAADPRAAADCLPGETRTRLATLGIGVDGSGADGDEDAGDWQGLTDDCLRLLDLLEQRRPGQHLQEVALLAWWGYTRQEIAGKLDCALRSVERKVRLIRQEWEGEVRDVRDSR
jgi:DNA-directed RNA polymerase specialized sigma24 family protein